MWWPCYTSSTSPSRSTSWYYTYLWSHAIQGGGQAVKQISAVMILGPVWMQITSTSVYMPDRAPHSVAFLCYWWMGWWYQYCALSTKVSVIIYDVSRRRYRYRCIYMDFDASHIYRCIEDNFYAYCLRLLRICVRHVYMSLFVTKMTCMIWI